MCVVTVCCPGCGGDSGFEDPDPPVGVPQLPDIVPSPPEHVQMGNPDGKWTMSFSSVLVNIGEGDFILRAKRDPADGEWFVEQAIPYSEDGATLIPTPARLVWGGDGHEHWHVKRVATNRLVRLADDGTPSGKSWVDSKVGFCFYDFIRHRRVGIKDAHYVSRSCGAEGDRYVGMGLSRGWADVYALNLPGQSIDVSGVPDGRYRLIAEVDKPGWFKELRTDNNMTWIDIDLSTKDRVRFAKVTGRGPDPGARVVASTHAS